MELKKIDLQPLKPEVKPAKVEEVSPGTAPQIKITPRVVAPPSAGTIPECRKNIRLNYFSSFRLDLIDFQTFYPIFASQNKTIPKDQYN